MLSNPQILIVEDDLDHAFLEETALKESMHCDVLTVNSMADLRPEYIRNSNLILLDFNLPDATGADVLKKIRQVSDVPVLLITGDKQQRTAIETLKSGATDFLNKSPDNIRKLPQLVLNSLQKYQQQKEQQTAATELSRREAKVETLHQVLTTLAHYINNSTTTIYGYAQLCQQYPDDKIKQRKLAEIGIKETRKISLVLEELENFVNTTEIRTTDYINIPEAMFAIDENLRQKMQDEE